MWLPVNWLERHARRGLGKEAAERVSAGCYGAVVAATTLAGSAYLPNWKLALLVVATNLVCCSASVGVNSCTP